MATNPKVSIALIAYNQQDYVGKTIESILNQTYQNFEIIVGDDSSTDETARVVKSYKDERIKYFKTDYNIGINGNLNLAVNVICGCDYIVLSDGDDKLRANYLECIVGYFEKMPQIDVLYPQLCAIDKDDNYIKGKDEYFWRISNKTADSHLRIGFMEGNFLISPGMAMRKKAVDTIFPLPYSLVNFQDYAMHIDILINGLKIYVLDEILVDYRISVGSISHDGDNILKREQMEIAPLMDYFLNIKDTNLLKRVFKNEIANTKIEPFSDTIPFFLGQMALLSSHYKRKEWGYHTIMKFLSDKSNFDIVNKRYDFTFKSYLKLISNITAICSIEDKNQYIKKYKKYKKCFNVLLIFFVALFIIFIIHIFVSN